MRKKDRLWATCFTAAMVTSVLNYGILCGEYNKALINIQSEKEILDSNIIKLNKELTELKLESVQKQISLEREIATLNKDLLSKNVIIDTLEKDLEKERNRVVAFEPSDLTIESNVYVNELAFVLSDTALEPYAAAIIKAEKEHSVNALGLASIMALESSWGTNYNARARNNYAGIRVNGKYKYFDSAEECIDYMAKLLSTEYLSPDGKWWAGDKSVSSVALKYCEQADHWSELVTQNANKFETILNKKEVS